MTVVSGVRFHRRHHDSKTAKGDLIDRFHVILKREAFDHHFTWVDNEAVLRATGDTEQFYLENGVHPNPARHRLLADAAAGS